MFPRVQDSLIPAAMLLFCVMVLGLTSCAGRITKKDCEKADFYEMGLEDGKDGATVERLAKYKAACPAEGVAVLEERYNYGYQVGLADYCDEGRGRSDAKKLERTSVCADAKVPPYQKAYAEEVIKNKDKITEELADIQKTKDELEKKQNELKARLDQISTQESTLL